MSFRQLDSDTLENTVKVNGRRSATTEVEVHFIYLSYSSRHADYRSRIVMEKKQQLANDCPDKIPQGFRYTGEHDKDEFVDVQIQQRWMGICAAYLLISF